MKEMIFSTFKIMFWLGFVLMILAIVNIVTGTLVNTWQNKESFDIKKMFKGIFKVFLFYICAVCLGIAFTILPFINNMIAKTFDVVLLSNDLLNTLSSVGVLTIVISTIIIHGKKAITGIIDLANLSSNSDEEIINNENIE